MKQSKVYKGLTGGFAACLLVAVAGCSSSQKPAALTPAGASATGSASSASGSATPTQAATSSASSSASSAASSSPAAPAPTTVSTSANGWTFKASVPGDANAAAAMAAFQHYRSITYQMSSKPDYSTDLANYADGTVLTLANNFVQELKAGNAVMVGTLSESALVEKVDMNAAPLPLVTISGCVNENNYHQVYAYGPNKGKSAADGFSHPFPATFTVHKGTDGKWRVTGVKSESAKTC